MVDAVSIQTYNYEGRNLCQIHLPGNGLSEEQLNEYTADLSDDLVVIRDRFQHSIIHLFSTLTGNVVGDGKYVHSVSILEKCFKYLFD